MARIESPVLKTLANRLLQSERLGVANVEPGFVFGQYGTRDSESVGERWFLPTQMPLAEVKQKMYKLQLHKDSLFVEFFTWFSGLQYDLDFICGFSDLRSVQVFDDEIALGCDFSEPYQEWIGSPIIFHGLDGSVILARTDGSVGFWQVGETAISKSKSTFRDVVFQFANLLGTTSPCVDLDPWLR